jgi:sugar O-acyltransferase (sialic acid O-acetyltransferase NeuD family)
MSNPKYLLIFGAGGHAKVTIEAAESAGVSEIKLFDMDSSKVGTEMLGRLIQFSDGRTLSDAGQFLVAVGDNRKRRMIFEQLSVNYSAKNVIHGAATVSSYSKLGSGVVIFSHACMNPSSVISDNTIINTAAVVEHDCNVGAHAHIGPKAVLCGGVTVGDESFIGAGAVVLPGITVGKCCVVGAGAVVTRNVPDNTVVLGSPARVLRKY